MARAAVVVLALLLAPAALAGSGRDSVEIADALQIVVLKRQLLAIDARGGGQREEDLELGERVLWTGSDGLVGVALTDERALLVGTRSASWQAVRYRLGEPPPARALLGARVALVTTRVRLLGFAARPASVSETTLGPQEQVVTQDVADNLAVTITDRRAIGLSGLVGGFSETPLRLAEKITSLSVLADVATLATDQRLLIYRAPSGSWEERRLELR